MKKILFALIGTALLAVGCAKEKDYYLEQNPYRKIVEYTPDTFTLEVPGTLTADATYDWITLTQSGNTATFTVRRNTTGIIREADYTISGKSQKAKIFQRAHSLDAKLSTSFAGKDEAAGTLDVKVGFATAALDDYASWGIIYATQPDVATGKKIAFTDKPSLDGKTVTLDELDLDGVYYFWSYVESTEGDIVYSSLVGYGLTYYANAGDNLQQVLDEAPEFAEIRVAGGATFNGPISFENNQNKSLTGGWNADFTEQSWSNLTVIDGKGKNRGFYVGADSATDAPLEGTVEISYFEIKNGFCGSGHGSALHVSGGPVTIHHCYIHDCLADRGTIGTHEDGTSSDITIYDNIIVNNFADGHAAAISIEDGDSRANPTKAVIVGNLIANNRSSKYDGYAASIYLYQGVDVTLVNNTIVNNGNFWEYGGQYPQFVLRENTCAVIANNLILHHWGTKITDTDDGTVADDPIVDSNPFSWGGSRVTFSYNMVEGGSLGTAGPAEGNTFVDAGMNLSSVLKNPDDKMVMATTAEVSAGTAAPLAYTSLSDFLGSNYTPVGAAVGAGSLATFSYASYSTVDLGVIRNCDIKATLEGFGTDINGKPFIQGGTVSLGALAAE